MKKQERINRIIARGETSGHSHIVVGDATIIRDNEKITITVDGKCAIKHLLEQPFVEEGKEVWTKEHKDISLKKGVYEVVRQREFDPYEQAIRRVQD